MSVCFSYLPKSQSSHIEQESIFRSAGLATSPLFQRVAPLLRLIQLIARFALALVHLLKWGRNTSMIVVTTCLFWVPIGNTITHSYVRVNKAIYDPTKHDEVAIVEPRLSLFLFLLFNRRRSYTSPQIIEHNYVLRARKGSANGCPLLSEQGQSVSECRMLSKKR
jgi:hypothetical protein